MPPHPAARRELAESVGIRHWGRVPALNTDPGFIGDLAEAVLEALPYCGPVGSGGGSGPAPAAGGTQDSLVPMGEQSRPRAARVRA